jgi:tRNA pseudouridine55 synthase
MDGILNINKSPGMTSFSVVARVKRLSGERHAGHAGTLDPQATGVIPICLGQATRIIEYLFEQTKTYRTEVELGISTDTYDSTGQIIQVKNTDSITLERIEAALAGFRGAILQTPPMYSALKYRGTPLYKLARSGIEVERKNRQAQIHSLEILDWQPPVITLEITCGKGTYIRSLAHDLGEELGCGANMKSLIRTKVGRFDIRDAITLSQLEETCRNGLLQEQMYPLDFVLPSFSAIVVNEEQKTLLIHGMPVSLQQKQDFGTTNLKKTLFFRAYSGDGHFLGMVKYDPENRLWRPDKIFFKS